MRMRDLASEAASRGSALPDAYPRRYFRVWFALGVPAFLALVVVFYLMAAKPAWAVAANTFRSSYGGVTSSWS